MSGPVTEPMLLSESEVAIETLMADPMWAFEQKMDGARAIVNWKKGVGFSWTTRNGSPLKFTAATQHLEAIERDLAIAISSSPMVLILEELTLDGEIIVDKGVYHVFDLPWVQGSGPVEPLCDTGTTYFMRRTWLTAIFQEPLDVLDLEHFKVVKYWNTPHEKADVWEMANGLGLEGLVAKDLHGVYEPGKRVKHQLKFKIVKTADVVVMSAQRTFNKAGTVTYGKAKLGVVVDEDPKPWRHKNSGARRSHEGMTAIKANQRHHYTLDPREVVEVGNASLIGKDLTIETGDVVEVAYLNFQGAMVQPRILRKRTDKQPEECRLDQFPQYSREVLK